jgi:hypothetical protein
MDKALPVPEKCREVYRKPCLCGGGEIMVDVCRPDEPYPTTKRYQGRFTCEACGKKYQVMEQDTDILLVEQAEVKKREKLLKQWNEECETLMTSTKVLKLLGQFRELLSRSSDVQRLGEYLRHVGLIHETDQEFVESYQDPPSWIKHHIRASHLPKVLEILQVEDLELMEKVQSLEALWRQSKIPFEPCGKPLFKKNPYQ